MHSLREWKRTEGTGSDRTGMDGKGTAFLYVFWRADWIGMEGTGRDLIGLEGIGTEVSGRERNGVFISFLGIPDRKGTAFLYVR